MKSAHVRFDAAEYEWLKAAAKADRRSVSSFIELLVLDALAQRHADKRPQVPPTAAPAPATMFCDEPLFDDEPTEE